jgi:hypothetical protein
VQHHAQGNWDVFAKGDCALQHVHGGTPKVHERRLVTGPRIGLVAVTRSAVSRRCEEREARLVDASDKGREKPDDGAR